MIFAVFMFLILLDAHAAWHSHAHELDCAKTALCHCQQKFACPEVPLGPDSGSAQPPMNQP